MRLSLLSLLSLSTLGLARHSRRASFHNHGNIARGLEVDLGASVSAGINVDLWGSHVDVDETVSTDVGKTVFYDVVVSEGLRNPDGGKERMVYLINGEFPGKPLYLDQGDKVEMNVHANTTEGLTVHFHGISQQGTPWSDGVPGVSQRVIPPGGNFTYRWNANQHGTFQTHAHNKQQQDDGLVFPIFIRPRADLDRPFAQIAALAGGNDEDVKAMVAAEANTHIFTVMDWRHRTSTEVNQIWETANVEPLCVDSILINGRGAVVCPPEEELKAFADARGFGDLTPKGCLPIDSPIINPEGKGFRDDANISAVPEETWKTCNPTGADRELYTVEVDPSSNGTWASFGIVNTGGLWEINFSIDEHPFYVYAIDGQYVNTTKPFNIISIPSGVRYQVLVKLDKEPGSVYTIRAAANVVPQIVSAYGVFKYTGNSGAQKALVAPASGYPAIPQSSAAMDYAGAPVALKTDSNNSEAPKAALLDPWTDAPPYPANPPPTEADGNITMVVLGMSRPNATIWAANSTGLQGVLYEEGDPLIWPTVWKPAAEAIVNNTGALAGSALINAHSVTILPNDTLVDIIITVVGAHPYHPMHKHYNQFWVIGQGQGVWNYSSVAEAAAAMPESFNFANPPVRDNFNTPATEEASWLAIRYRTVNPGPDLIHCHLSQHATGGMVEVLLTGIELVDLPEEYAPPKSQ
ncbi:Cupredoxin [Trametes elegans]|nr:Cupredoxin [Trametes elegans]